MEFHRKFIFSLIGMWWYPTSIDLSDFNTPKYQKNVILPKQARLKRITSIWLYE